MSAHGHVERQSESTGAKLNRQRKTDKSTKVSGKSASRQPSKRAINSSNLYKLRKFVYLLRALTFYTALYTSTYTLVAILANKAALKWYRMAVKDNKVMKKWLGWVLGRRLGKVQTLCKDKKQVRALFGGASSNNS